MVIIEEDFDRGILRGIKAPKGFDFSITHIEGIEAPAEETIEKSNVKDSIVLEELSARSLSNGLLDGIGD